MNNNSPLVSVIMPVYNAEEYIEEAIESILNQIYTNIEFLIIDDGSIDNSLKIINQYQDSRITIIHHPQNQGLILCLNEGLSLSKGMYIDRMDADDISMPERIVRQFKGNDVTPNHF